MQKLVVVVISTAMQDIRLLLKQQKVKNESGQVSSIIQCFMALKTDHRERSV